MYPWKVLNNRALIETLRPGGLVRDLCLTETGNVTEQCVTRNLSARGGAAFGAGCGHSRIRLVDLPILIRLAKKHASARLEVMLRFDWPCWQEIDLGVTFAASAAGMKNMA